MEFNIRLVSEKKWWTSSNTRRAFEAASYFDYAENKNEINNPSFSKNIESLVTVSITTHRFNYLHRSTIFSALIHFEILTDTCQRKCWSHARWTQISILISVSILDVVAVTLPHFLNSWMEPSTVRVFSSEFAIRFRQLGSYYVSILIQPHAWQAILVSCWDRVSGDFS